MNLSATLSFLAIALQVACSSTTPPPTLQLPKSLKIASIQVAGAADSWSPQNAVSLPLACTAQTQLLVTTDPAPDPIASTIDNFTIAVPGSCGSLISCGWFTLRITPSIGSEIEVATAISPITVGGISLAGSYEFALELHDAYDNVLKAADGNPFGDQQTVEFTAQPTCPAPSDGDAGT